MLGRWGLSLEEHCTHSMNCLEHFAEADLHARQYITITQALFKATRKHIEEREVRLRSRRHRTTSQLFGLLPVEPTPSAHGATATPNSHAQRFAASQEYVTEPATNSDWSIYDADFFAVPWFDQSVDEGLQDFLQSGRQALDGSLLDIPLFPMNDEWPLTFDGEASSGL